MYFFSLKYCSCHAVPRQEDYGLDFLCALTRKEGPSLYIEKEFAVQAKSVSDKNKYVVYGGFDKKGTWKKWEVEWLYRQTHPLFIAYVDCEQWNVKLFAVARTWYVRYLSGPSFEIKLLLEESPETVTGERFPCMEIKKAASNMGDRKSWRIPLGKPIVDITVHQLEDPKFRNEIYECINKWIDLERKNIQNRHLGIPISVEFDHWDTNKAPMGCLLTMRSEDNIKYYPFYNSTPGWHIDQTLAAMTAPALALALNSAIQGRSEELEFVKPALELLVKRAYLDAKMLNHVIQLIKKPC